MDARIREAGPADRDALVELMREFYAETDSPFESNVAAASFERLLEDRRLGRAWLFEAGGVPAGYFVMTLGFSMEYGGPSAFLDDLFIRPDFRGRGIGRAALRTLRATCEALDVRAIHLEVAPDNPAAQKLYREAGFVGRHLQFLTLHLRTPHQRQR